MADALAWEQPKPPPVAITVAEFDKEEREMQDPVRSHKKKNSTVKQRPTWNAELDAILCLEVRALDSSTLAGKGYWPTIAQNVPGRSSKQCRERWVNHLDPNLARDRVGEEEFSVIMEIFNRVGRRWSCLAGHLNAWRISKGLPGFRSDGSLKNLICRRHREPQCKSPEKTTNSINAENFLDLFHEDDTDDELSMTILKDFHLALESPPITAPENDKNIFAADDSSEETTPMPSPEASPVAHCAAPPVALIDPTRPPGLTVKVSPPGAGTSRPSALRSIRAQPFQRIGAARKVNFNFKFTV